MAYPMFQKPTVKQKRPNGHICETKRRRETIMAIANETLLAINVGKVYDGICQCITIPSLMMTMAIKNIGSSSTEMLHLHSMARLQTKMVVLVQKRIGFSANLNRVGLGATFHAAGNIDGIAP